MIGQAEPPFGLNSRTAAIRAARSSSVRAVTFKQQCVAPADLLTLSEFFTKQPRPFGLPADAHSCDASLVSGSVPIGTKTYAGCLKITSNSSETASRDHCTRAEDLAIANECRLNILWWHSVEPEGRALEVEVPALSLTAALRALYRQLDRIPLAALVDSHPPTPLPFADGAFRLVTLYGHSPSHSELTELRRVLAPGGTLLLACGNRWWKGRWGGAGLRSGHGSATLAQANSLRDVGFVEVCPYWVEPSLAIPRSLIPAVGGRARQFEAIRAREWGPSPLRAFAAATGMSALLYPALLFVARTPAPAVSRGT